ncbi:hypothetical protein PoB_001854100 [Plakobranchus ocellatus]|uniref:Uncharacterized protein n=1 Tax=Plakobranchus ocellatus TaxID=259542 RepID=A0AAV3ZBJ9_9GAST|nr:hypothetical protein PoB_001854100 [Plakobranchus ocellatus]
MQESTCASATEYNFWYSDASAYRLDDNCLNKIETHQNEFVFASNGLLSWPGLAVSRVPPALQTGQPLAVSREASRVLTLEQAGRVSNARHTQPLIPGAAQPRASLHQLLFPCLT